MAYYQTIAKHVLHLAPYAFLDHRIEDSLKLMTLTLTSEKDQHLKKYKIGKYSDYFVTIYSLLIYSPNSV